MISIIIFNHLLRFLKSCIFDACACDQGGDCECLCTAIAAYAHACTMKGIPIRWRTPDLCREYKKNFLRELSSEKLITFI